MSFDRATDYYDATRGLPPEVREAVAAVVSAELAGRGWCLEIGVGTGRIGLPLHARGVALVGIDLSAAMLGRLATNAGGRAPFPLVVGDATAVPLRDGSVGAVLASHVLHLVPAWPVAAQEVRRVVRPGGVLLVDFGGLTPAPWDKPALEVLARRGIIPLRPGVSDAPSLARHLGVAARALGPVTMTVRRSLAADLDDWERQQRSWTWSYSTERMAAGCADVRAWAEESGWPLDEEVELTRVIQWWAFDLAG